MNVVKFGGSSLANAQNILKAKNIINQDPARTFVVVSAPGKSAEYNRKITDLLIDAHTGLCFDDDSESVSLVFERFKKISDDLGINIDAELERAREEVFINKCDYDFVISRGEYIMAILFARVLGYKFLDAACYVVIKKNGTADIEATRKNFARLDKNAKYVMGGFYGVERSEATYRAERSEAVKRRYGRIRTFSRGGSDYSGAVAAVCLNAEIYENFTDTYGVQTANPSLVKNTQNIAEIDYKTLFMLCNSGATVIYPLCIPLLERHAVPLRVDNTFDNGVRSTIVTRKRARRPFFSITYETGHNINKETAQILCVLNKTCFSVHELKTLFAGQEVYLTQVTPTQFRLLIPAANLGKVVNQLHKALSKNIN